MHDLARVTEIKSKCWCCQNTQCVTVRYEFDWTQILICAAHQHIQEKHISFLNQSINLDSRSQSNTKQQRPVPFQDIKTVRLMSKQELAQELSGVYITSSLQW